VGEESGDSLARVIYEVSKPVVHPRRPLPYLIDWWNVIRTRKSSRS